MKFSLTISMVLLWIAATGCEKEYYYGPEDQPVYFEYHYINHAWGVADNGWMIDLEGRMLGYDRPTDYRWPDSNGHLSLGDLNYNLSQADTLLLTVKRKEFERHSRLIGGAASGTLSDRSPKGADMGSATFSCYFFDHETESYKHVLLEATGDWEQLNQSTEAEKIVKWLKDL